jgi:hypothetical protein
VSAEDIFLSVFWLLVFAPIAYGLLMAFLGNRASSQLDQRMYSITLFLGRHGYKLFEVPTCDPDQDPFSRRFSLLEDATRGLPVRVVYQQIRRAARSDQPAELLRQLCNRCLQADLAHARRFERRATL